MSPGPTEEELARMMVELREQYRHYDTHTLALETRIDVAVLLDVRRRVDARLSNLEGTVLAHDRAIHKVWGAFIVLVFLAGTGVGLVKAFGW